MKTTALSFILMLLLSGDCGVNNPNMILAMGDSITSAHGYEPPIPPNEWYPARIAAMTGKTVMNEGQSGSRSTYGVLYIRTYIDRYKPRIVTILYGVNDIGERSVENIAENLRTMIRYSKENDSIPIIATLTPIFGRRAWKAPSVRDLNNIIRALAREEEVLLADLEAAFGWNSRHFPDGLHPDSAGMEIIANTFLQAIRQVPDCEK